MVSRAGDERDEQYRDFVAASSRRLLHMAELLVPAAEAEDLVQGVLVNMYPRWRKIAQQDPVGYARRALVNAATDRWRRHRGRERLTDSVPEAVQPWDTADRATARESVLGALHTLTDRERAVIVLRYYEDLSESEIARVLGFPAGTVKSTASRALRKLRVAPELRPDKDMTTDEVHR